MSKRPPLSFRQYWNHVGTDNIEKLAANIGSGMAFFRALKYGTKTPSESMAERIIAGAKNTTPGWAPDKDLMVAGDEERVGRRIEPSDEYLRSQKRRKVLM